MLELKLRPSVQAFVQRMELKLRQNDHKSGWEEALISDLLLRDTEELGECVSEYYRELNTRGFVTSDSEHFKDELADVANFMMIHDILKEKELKLDE